jgi:hypothetical protein
VALLKVSKYAPEILTGVGILGVVGGTILIARAATRLEPIIDQHERNLALAKEDLERAGDDLSGVDYTEKEVKREITKVYVRTGLALTKEFGPGVSLEIFSLVSILAAHGIMRRRAVALLGAYKAVEQAFGEYRNRVAAEFGEEKEREIRYGIRTESVEDENGKKTKRKVWDPASFYSPYAKVFDEGNSNYRDTPEYNLMFLKNQQAWANDKLQIQGYLFLCDIYDALGFERTPQSQIVGWLMDPSSGDMQVDFGIYNTDVEKARDFVNGLEKSIILDFNVDGVILDGFDRIVKQHQIPE